MAIEVENIIIIAISMMVIAVILPLALGLLAIAGETVISNVSGNVVYFKDAVDPSVLTILTVLVPILAVVGIAITFIKVKD